MSSQIQTEQEAYNEKLLSVALNKISTLLSANLELETLLVLEKDKTFNLEEKLKSLEAKK